MAGVASIYKYTIMAQTLPFISKNKQEKLTIWTQLPFHKDKDFQQSKFFKQMLIVLKACTAGCVEQESKFPIDLDYQRQSKEPDLNLSVQ